MNETRSGVNDRPRPSVVSRSSRRQLPTVTSSSGTEPEGRGWSDKRRMWEGAWKERECSVAKGPDRHAPSLPCCSRVGSCLSCSTHLTTLSPPPRVTSRSEASGPERDTEEVIR